MSSSEVQAVLDRIKPKVPASLPNAFRHRIILEMETGYFVSGET